MPVLYTDPFGTIANPSPTNQLTLDSRGEAGFYLPESRFDYIVFGAAPAALPYSNGEAGWARSISSWLNARDFPSIQAAIDSLPPEGGTVFIPEGTYTLAATLYMPCDRPCHLVGSNGSRFGGKGTQIVNATGSDILRLRGNYSSVRNLVLDGTGSPAASSEETGRGLVIGRRAIVDPHPFPGANPANTEVTNGGGSILESATVEDVEIRNTSGWGVFVAGTGKLSDGSTNETGASAGITLSIFVTMSRVTVVVAAKYGGLYTGQGNTTHKIVDSRFLGMGAGRAGANARYAYLKGAEKLILDHCTFEGISPGTNAWVKILASAVTMRDCVFEEDDGDASNAAPGYFVETSDGAWGPTILSPVFYRNGTVMPNTYKGMLRLIKIINASNGHLVSNPLAFTATDPFPSGSWVEQNHVDLGSGSLLGVVAGTGALFDTSHTPIVRLPIQYANPPLTSIILGDTQFKIPVLTVAQRDAVTNFVWPDGSIALVTDLAPNSGVIQARTLGGWRVVGAGIKTTAGAPTSGKWAVGDQVVNTSDNKLYVCVAAGTPGTWKSTTLA